MCKQAGQKRLVHVEIPFKIKDPSLVALKEPQRYLNLCPPSLFLSTSHCNITQVMGWKQYLLKILP